jgi:uncharacterized membrane protein (DUF485 family)
MIRDKIKKILLELGGISGALFVLMAIVISIVYLSQALKAIERYEQGEELYSE